ncbi:helix-turn-helix domain-containing protein [Lactobacillus sp. S2-2]|uniref:transposase n=1 Tax=Lactobacillus sp. S2-2 TaxID=2692917 RepID=UPI001F1CDB5A|nr:transposase [Lactobacillus sp. S2-2]MCF6514972.1 helix-turn-helix domain-containing protein [Lactobacillus sp. S2-2]
MTKFNKDKKIEAIKYYLNNTVSLKETAKKYNIKSKTTLSHWIDIYEAKEPNGLEVRKTHRRYSEDFKFNMVNYYKTHESSAHLVAIKFNINSSQIDKK